MGFLARPTNNQKITFNDYHGRTFNGVFIEKEELFLVEETEEFFYWWQVRRWTPNDSTNPQEDIPQ